MKIRSHKLILYITGILLFIFFSFINYIFTIKFTIPNTDINQQYLMSDNFLNKGNFFYLDELDKKQPENERFIGIRGLLYYENNHSFSASSMPGMIILFTLFKGISNFLLIFINPIFVFILFIYIFKIIKILFNKISDEKALIISIIILLSSQTIYNGSFLFNNLAATTIFIVGLYYLLKIDKSYKYGLLFSVFLGIAVWFRYSIIIFYIPFILYKFIPLFKKSYIYIIPFILFFIPLIYYQNIYFDGFLNFNNPTYRLNHFKDISKSVVNTGVLSSIIANFDLKVFVNNMINQIFKVSPVIVLVLIIGIFNIKSIKNKTYIFILFGLIIFQCLFFCGKIWSGYYFSEGGIGTSYTRYLFVTWISIIILSIYFFFQLKINKKIKIFFILMLIVFSISYAINSNMGLRYFYSTSNTISRLKERLESFLPNKSVVLTNFDDKYLYGLKGVKILPYIAISPNNYKRVITNYILNNKDYTFFIYREDIKICSLFNCKSTSIKNLYKLSIKNTNEQN